MRTRDHAMFVYFHFALPLIFAPVIHIMAMVDAAEAPSPHDNRQRIQTQDPFSSGKAYRRPADRV